MTRRDRASALVDAVDGSFGLLWRGDAMEWLRGKRTYLIATAVGVVQFLKVAGYLDSETARTLTEMLVGGGLATLHAAISRNK